MTKITGAFGVCTLALFAGSAAAAYTGPYNEVERNNNPLQVFDDPNRPAQLYELPTVNTTGVLLGKTTGSNNSDVTDGNEDAGLATQDIWRLTTGTFTPGIYRHTLTRPNNSSYSVWFHGTVSSVGPRDPVADPSGTSLQSSTPGNSVRGRSFFAFGAPAVVYYRIAGSNTTTTQYAIDYSVAPVTPTNAGSVSVSNSGTLTMTTSHPSFIDTEIFVYNSSYALIAHNDNYDVGNDFGKLVLKPAGSSTSPVLTSGTYYVAVTSGYSNGESSAYYNNVAPGFNQERFAGTVAYPYDPGALYAGNSSSNASGFTLGLQADAGAVASTPAPTGLAVQDASWFKFTLTVGPKPCNKADITDGSGTGSPDGALTGSDVVTFFGSFFSPCTGVGAIPCNKADITDGSGTGNSDGALTGSDVVTFFSNFFSPCVP